MVNAVVILVFFFSIDQSHFNFLQDNVIELD